MNCSNNGFPDSSNTASSNDQQAIYDRENAAIEAAIASEIHLAERIRSSNANFAYLPTQAKFKKWCEDKHYENDIVSEMKIVRYVNELFHQGKQSIVTNADNTTTTTRTAYSHETLKMHINALIDLHRKQKVEYQNVMTIAHPRGVNLKSFEANLKRLCPKALENPDENLALSKNNTTRPSEVEIHRVLPEINSRLSELSTQLQVIRRRIADRTFSDEHIEDIANKISGKIIDRFGSNSTTVSNSSEQTEINRGVLRREREDNLENSDSRKRYRLNRKLTTIVSLWKEWSVGLTEGQPSILSLNEEFGTKWRQESKERKYYSQRLVLINEIRRIAEEKTISLADAAQTLENERLVKGCSLDKLCKILQIRNKL